MRQRLQERENRFQRDVKKMEHRSSRSRSRSQSSFHAAEQEAEAIREIIESDRALMKEVRDADEAIGAAAREKLAHLPASETIQAN